MNKSVYSRFILLRKARGFNMLIAVLGLDFLKNQS